eukprot:Skav217605  [mRNA]  locus=scaffold2172:79867:90166:+ [translate_table: standard]
MTRGDTLEVSPPPRQEGEYDSETAYEEDSPERTLSVSTLGLQPSMAESPEGPAGAYAEPVIITVGTVGSEETNIKANKSATTTQSTSLASRLFELRVLSSTWFRAPARDRVPPWRAPQTAGPGAALPLGTGVCSTDLPASAGASGTVALLGSELVAEAGGLPEAAAELGAALKTSKLVACVADGPHFQQSKFSWRRWISRCLGRYGRRLVSTRPVVELESASTLAVARFRCKATPVILSSSGFSLDTSQAGPGINVTAAVLLADDLPSADRAAQELRKRCPEASLVGAVGARWLMKDRPVPCLAALGAEGSVRLGEGAVALLLHGPRFKAILSGCSPCGEQADDWLIQARFHEAPVGSPLRWHAPGAARAACDAMQRSGHRGALERRASVAKADAGASPTGVYCTTLVIRSLGSVTDHDIRWNATGPEPTFPLLLAVLFTLQAAHLWIRRG